MQHPLDALIARVLRCLVHDGLLIRAAEQGAGIERLCRYDARPALALEQLI